jgi:hypothetical protein
MSMMEGLVALILKIYRMLGRMAVHHTSSIENLSHTTMRMMQITAGRKLEPLDRSSWMQHCEVARRCLPCMLTWRVIKALRKLIGDYISIIYKT